MPIEEIPLTGGDRIDLIRQLRGEVEELHKQNAALRAEIDRLRRPYDHQDPLHVALWDAINNVVACGPQVSGARMHAVSMVHRALEEMGMGTASRQAELDEIARFRAAKSSDIGLSQHGDPGDENHTRTGKNR